MNVVLVNEDAGWKIDVMQFFDHDIIAKQYENLVMIPYYNVAIGNTILRVVKRG